jgi:hypothetical protein
MAVSSEWAVIEIEDVRMDGPPGDERRSLVVERAFADLDDLKGSVATTLVILLGEASGLLASIGLGLIETRLKVCADGWNSRRRRRRVPILRCGKSDRPWIAVASDGPRGKGGEAEASPVRWSRSKRDIGVVGRP